MLFFFGSIRFNLCFVYNWFQWFRFLCRKSMKVLLVFNFILFLILIGFYGLKYQVEEECGFILMVLVQNKVDFFEEVVIFR